MEEEHMAKRSGYGFGIVGCGMIADFQAKAIEAMKGGHLACAFSRNLQNARRLAEQFGCRAYDDYKAFLAHPGWTSSASRPPAGRTWSPASRRPGPVSTSCAKSLWK